MSKSTIMSNELCENFSFAVRDDRSGKIGFVKIKDFLEILEIEGDKE